MDPLNLPAAFVVVIAILASARLFRLATVDAVGYPYRWAVAKVVNAVHPKSPAVADTIDEGAFCSFCIGFWIALGVLASALAWHDTVAWQLVVGALAVNYVSGHLSGALDADSIDEDA